MVHSVRDQQVKQKVDCCSCCWINMHSKVQRVHFCLHQDVHRRQHAKPNISSCRKSYICFVHSRSVNHGMPLTCWSPLRTYQDMTSGHLLSGILFAATMSNVVVELQTLCPITFNMKEHSGSTHDNCRFV